jgi:hypothetical protein
MKDKEIQERNQKVEELKKTVTDLNTKLLDTVKEYKEIDETKREKNNQIKLALKELQNSKDRIIQKH